MSTTSHTEHLHRLAKFEAPDFPVISLYLNTQADEYGKDSFGPFLRKELDARLKTYDQQSPARVIFEKDADRIKTFLAQELQPSSNSVAIFACSGG